MVQSIRVLHFDFGSATSRDESRTIVEAQAVLRSGTPEHAVALWKALLEVASSMRADGGTLDEPGLVERLRGRFELREHPDYRQDWTTLDRRTRDDLDDIRSRIDGLTPLAREGDSQRVLTALEKHPACLLVGDSGAGKSALAKSLADYFDRIVWLQAEDLADDRTQLHTRLGLHHAFDEVLSSARERVLVVIDATERLSLRATKVLAKTICDIHQRTDVASLLTAQGEAATRLVGWLRDGGLSEVEVVALERPSEDSIRVLLADFSGLKWTLLRPEVRPALRNLKVLEWIVQAVQRGEVLDEAAILNVSGLIELLWRRWVEADGGDLGRSEALMRLGAAEAEMLVRGVARLALGVEAAAISELARSGLLRIRDERVSFTHDLLGDWARLRVLIGEVPDDVGKLRSRAEKPRWHRAIRLYGQWVVDHGAGDPTAWFDLLRAVDDGTTAGTISRDLLLEAPFLASNADAVLEAVWPKLIADDASLLETMLKRFLYVGTVPDPAMTEHFRGRDDAKMAAHLFRVPLPTYWGAMLRVLNRHSGDVSRLVADVGAEIAKLWLRWTLPAVQRGQRIAWRSEAASLALRIAEDFRASVEEQDFHPSKESKPIFEALLYGAPDEPKAVGALCLELCYRKPLAEGVGSKRARAAEERAAWRKAHPVPEKYAYLTKSVLPRGEIREPWADGPSRRVSETFAEACLDAGAFAALTHADARVAREVLLAVCIEAPKHDDPHGYSLRHDDLGLRHWQGGYPALYFRGPFLRFLHDSPDEALTFVLRLVNFATERWIDGFVRYARRDGSADASAPGIEVVIRDKSRRWSGEDAVYQWHYSSDLGNGAVPCALMALEFWLHQCIDAGDDVSPTIERIMVEGRSLAFAGLLLDIGKRHADLLVGAMRPLLAVWQLYDLDSQLVSGRSSAPELIGWQGEPLAQLAIDWYGLEHRARRLWDVVAELALTRGDLQEFFRTTREAWSRLLRNDRPEVLRLLIERLNPASYVPAKLPDGTPVLVPQWPEHIRKRHAEELPAMGRGMEEMTLPWQCRKWLDGTEGFVAEDATRLWEVAQRVAKGIDKNAVRSEAEINDPRSVVYGVIATLIARCPEWLAKESSRLVWCRNLLEQALSAPLPSRVFGEPSPSMERGFDAFAAEAGTVLLARDRTDLLGRKLAAWGATSMRPNVTGRVMSRAFLERAGLGEDFRRLQALVVAWSGLRGTIRIAKYARHDDAQLHERRQLLAATFVDGLLDATRATLASVDAEAAAEQEQIAASTQRGSMGLDRRPPRAPIALDERTLMSGFSWIDLRVGEPEERASWITFLEEALALVLAVLPEDDGAKNSYNRSSIPKDMDTWVLEYTARAIPQLDDARGAGLWRPILSMGATEHHWVETFLMRWNVSGSQTAPSVRRFGELWRSMISFALEHEMWHPRYGARDYDVARLVRELLGFGWKVDNASSDAQSGCAAEIATAIPLFARAAQRWFNMPYVAVAFVSLATQNAGRALLLPGLAWLEEAVGAYDDEDWSETSLTDAIVRFLRTTWERERRAVASDPRHRKRFEALLSVLAARGSHAAQSLRDELVDSVHDG